MSSGLPELSVIAAILLPPVGAVGLIGILCYVWMKNSRASQTRTETYNQQIISLLREQNDLLKRLMDGEVQGKSSVPSERG